jgi:bifunctional UDP-N-acetylglucosamine pyrophosphorylase/glucosamine-1-phosphate N-acetyltransferase
LSVGAIVLAAGQGTRMRSRRPKVLHALAGRTMLGWVLAALSEGGVERTVAVVGHGAEEVARTLPEGVAVAIQAEQLGTGHATAIGLEALPGDVATVVVACGDTPLLEGETVAELLAAHARSGDAATMVTAVLPEGGAYGRVIRDAAGGVARVVEARDADPEELAVSEVNAGLYAFDRAALADAIGRVGSDNDQGEVYLPDALPLLEGGVGALTASPEVILGVNNRVDLAACEDILRARIRSRLMLSGVTLADPAGVYVDADVEVGPDTVLHPGTHLRGATRVGAECEIGPDAVVVDSEIAGGCRVVASHVHESRLAAGSQVGPFAYLRPGADLAEGARAGTFVELKNATLGPGAKVPHLSYVGDAEVGEGTNIGAGTITANYDGFRKHRTVIGARVRTGSDCVFVAPVSVGDDAMTGAGSIITDDVPAGALGIARARQSVIEDFTRRAAERAASAANASREGAK